MAAGLRLIEEKGVRALTLREIGATVGVSRMAAYRHFADKADLLGAIQEAGFGEFADALEKARNAAAPDFASRMRAMALAYVRFAESRPAHFEVMFAAQVQRPASPAGARAFGILEQTIREGQSAGLVQPGDSVQLARVAWAQVHGIATLRLEGAGFVEFGYEILLRGLRGQEPGAAGRGKDTTG